MRKVLCLVSLGLFIFLVGCNAPTAKQGTYYNVQDSTSFIEVYANTCDLVNVDIVGLGERTYYGVSYVIYNNGTRIEITHPDFSAVASYDGTTISYNNQNFKK